MQVRAVRRAPRARRRRQADRRDAVRRVGSNRRRKETGTRARRRDDPVVAPRAVAVGHRTRCRDARKSGASRHRADAALSLKTPMIANARMYALNDAVAGAWRALFEWIGKRADVPLEMVDHAAPAPLAEL